MSGIELVTTTAESLDAVLSGKSLGQSLSNGQSNLLERL